MRIGKIIVLIVFGLILVLPAGLNTSSITENDQLHNEPQIAQTSNSNYTPHDPIYIWSDSAFEEQGWPGSGTPEDPYVIAGLNISGLSIYSSVFFVIRDCLLSCRIYLDNAENATLERLVFEKGVGGGERGIFLGNCEGILVKDCILTEQGIKIDGNDLSNWVHTFDNVSIGGKTLGYLNGMTDSVIDTSSFGQLIIVDCKRLIVDGDMANISDGFEIAFSDDCSLQNFKVNLDTWAWQRNQVLESNNINLENITFVTEYGSSIGIADCDNINVNGIKAIQSGSLERWSLEIYLRNCPSSNIRNISGINGQCFIRVLSSMDCIISETSTSRLRISDSSYSSITNCTSSGVDIDDSSHCNITNSTLGDFSLRSSNYISVNESTAQKISLSSSLDCQFNNISITKGGIELWGSEYSHWIHTFDNVTVGGKSWGYIVGLNDSTIDCSSYGQLILVDCENITVNGGISCNFSGSLVAAFSEDCSIRNVYKNNRSSGGVILYSCNRIIFENNSFYSIDESILSITDCTDISFVHSEIHCYSWVSSWIFNSADITFSNDSLINIKGGLDVIISNRIIISHSTIQYIRFDYSNSCLLTKSIIDDLDLSGCTDMRITENTVNRIWIYGSDNCHFEDIRALDISISRSTDCDFQDIIIENGTIRIRGNSLSDWDHSFTNVSIDGKSFGLFRGVSQSTIDCEEFCQLILIDCQYVNIFGRNSYPSIRYIQIAFSYYCTIGNLVIESEIDILKSSNILVANITGAGDMNHISIDDCSDVILHNCVIKNSYTCIYIYDSSNCQITNNVLEANYTYSSGITISSSDAITLSHNNINSDNGITIFSSELIQCNDNIIGSSYTGIEMYNSLNCDIERNNITNPRNGIITVQNEGCIYSGNRITNCDEDGIIINGDYQSTFAYNYITDSGNYAINLDYGMENEFFGNYLGNDVIDNGVNNEWFSHREFGNYWAGQSRGEPVNLNGSAGSVDQFPLIIEDNGQKYPTITNPPDFITGTSTTITWVAWCDPGDYVLLLNGMEVGYGVWTGSGRFQIHINTMEGEWLEFTLSIYNDDGWVITDTVASSGVIRIDPIYLTIIASSIVIAAIIVFEMSNRITGPLHPLEEK